jgi:fatty acid desaturase
MGFRFQRRLNLSGGWGLNLAKSGGSISYRNKYGALGTKGFSIRSGIPGLSFRQSWGKRSGAAALILAIIAIAIGAFMFLVLVFMCLLAMIWQCLAWLALTCYDFYLYVVERIKEWRAKANC